MLKKILYLAAIGGLIAMAGEVKAQTTVADFYLTPSINPSPPPADIGGASGSFRVILKQLGNAFTIKVTGVNDGRTNPPNHPSNRDDSPKNGIGYLQITLNPGVVISPAITGSTNKYLATNPDGNGNPAGGNKGSSNIVYGGTGGSWTLSSGVGPAPETVTYSAAFDAKKYVAPHGGNTFTGTFSTTGVKFTGISISAQDNGQQWSGQFGTFASVPESTSLALLLPGLVPLCIALRRRYASRS